MLLQVSDFASGSHCSKSSWPLNLSANAKAACNDVIVAEQATAGGTTNVSRMLHYRLLVHPKAGHCSLPWLQKRRLRLPCHGSACLMRHMLGSRPCPAHLGRRSA